MTARVEELIFTAFCDRFGSPTQMWQSMSVVELEKATGLAKEPLRKPCALCAGPMVATTRALRMVQDGSFSVQSGASSAEISRTIRDPTDHETARLALRARRDPRRPRDRRGHQGVVRGLDGRGYVKTSEGFGIVTRGCPDGDLWAAIVETATTVRPSGHAFSYGPLRILGADQGAGALRAEDPANFWRKGSNVGIFIYRLTEETRLVEVSSFWDTRTVVLRNPWERDLLDELVRRLSCVISSEQAILRMPGGGADGRLPGPRVEPTSAPSALFCRSRAEAAKSREQWYSDYRRCMAGY